MRVRVGGATLAALGGLLIAIAAVVPRWWHGPIQIAGKIIHGKTVHVSLLRVTGCNAGDGTCVGLDVGTVFRAVSLSALVAAAVTALMAGLLARATLRGAPSAPRHARHALVGAALAVVGGVATIITLPARFEEISVGGGAFAFFGGALAVLVASFSALLRRAPAAAATEPMDVREILSTDMLAPAALGPEPKMGRYGAVVPTGGAAGAQAPRFRPWYEVQAAQDPVGPGAFDPASGPASGGFGPPDTAPGFGPPDTAPGFGPGFGPPGTAPGFGPPSTGHGQMYGGDPGAPRDGERWATEANTSPLGASSTQVGVPLAPQGRASASHRVPSPIAPAAPGVGSTQVGVPLAPGAGGASSSSGWLSSPPSSASAASLSASLPSGSSGGMSFDVSDVTNPSNRLMAARAAAAPAAPSVPQVDPPVVPAGAQLPSDASSEPGFDSPTTPSQPSMATLLARGAGGAGGAEEASDSELRTQQVERLDSSELLEALEPAGDLVDSGVFLRGESAAAAAKGPPKRPSVPRVPTATTSASLAALAALSKPAVITMASNVARKLPHPKPSEISESNPTRACPTCVAPLGWVARHQRYYCTQCRAYY